MLKNHPLTGLFICLFGIASLAANEQDTSFVAFSETSGIGIMLGSEKYFRMDNAIWGPNWSWTSYRGNVTVEADKSISHLETTLKQTGAKLELSVETEQTAPRQLASIKFKTKIT